MDLAKGWRCDVQRQTMKTCCLWSNSPNRKKKKLINLKNKTKQTNIRDSRKKDGQTAHNVWESRQTSIESLLHVPMDRATIKESRVGCVRVTRCPWLFLFRTARARKKKKYIKKKINCRQSHLFLLKLYSTNENDMKPE